MVDVAKTYEAAGGERVNATFGPSGLLKDEIAGGAKVRDGGRLAEGPVGDVLNQVQLEALYRVPVEQLADSRTGGVAFLPG